MSVLIFVCVGSRQYQFNRLLKKLDELVEQGLIKEDVFAQIGESDYKPKYYSYKKFITPEEYDQYINQSILVISHGGSGSVIKALKAGKQVIAVPRLAKYKEHINDHQLQIVETFVSNKYVLAVYEMDELYGAIKAYMEKTADVVKYENRNTDSIVDRIDIFIQKTFKGIYAQ